MVGTTKFIRYGTCGGMVRLGSLVSCNTYQWSRRWQEWLGSQNIKNHRIRISSRGLQNN